MVLNNITPCKGKRLGNCNRTACQTPHLVVFWNKATQAYYCRTCTMMILQHCTSEEKKQIFPDFEDNLEEWRKLRKERNNSVL